MFKNNLKIRKALINEKTKIRNFILKNFYKKNHILALNPKLFDWQYINKSLSCSLAFYKKKIIGLQLYIPIYQFDFKLKKNNEFFTSLWFTKKTNIISLGAKIFYFTLKSNKPKLIIGMGIPQYLIDFHKKNNFIVKKMSHHFMFASKKKIKIKNKLKINKIFKFSKIDHIKLKHLFNYQYPKKSISYLENRFIKHPIYKYHIYSVQNKKGKCLCVFRIVRHKNKNIIRIVDYIGSNDFIKHLREFYINILEKYNAKYLDFYSYGLPNSKLKKSGLNNKEDFKNLIIPNHFEPFENKNIDIFIAYQSKYNKNVNIRLFKADSDMDRPHYTS